MRRTVGSLTARACGLHQRCLPGRSVTSDPTRSWPLTVGCMRGRGIWTTHRHSTTTCGSISPITQGGSPSLPFVRSPHRRHPRIATTMADRRRPLRHSARARSDDPATAAPIGPSDPNGAQHPRARDRSLLAEVREFGLGEPVPLADDQVPAQLLGAAVGHQGSTGDQAAVPGTELGPRLGGHGSVSGFVMVVVLLSGLSSVGLCAGARTTGPAPPGTHALIGVARIPTATGRQFLSPATPR